MSTLKATTIEPATGTNLTLGASGDTIELPGNTLALDTWKDSGGNTLFVSDGAGTLSNVQSEFKGGGPVLIQSQVADAASSTTFSSNIDSTYDTYMFTLNEIHCSVNGEDMNVNFSATGTFTNILMQTSAIIAQHDQNGANGQVVYQANMDSNNAANQKFADSSQLGNVASESFSAIMYLYQPSSTTFVKYFNFRTTAKGKVPGSTSAWVSGYANNSGAAVTQVQFAPSSGTFTGTIKMYGIV